MKAPTTQDAPLCASSVRCVQTGKAGIHENRRFRNWRPNFPAEHGNSETRLVYFIWCRPLVFLGYIRVSPWCRHRTRIELRCESNTQVLGSAWWTVLDFRRVRPVLCKLAKKFPHSQAQDERLVPGCMLHCLCVDQKFPYLPRTKTCVEQKGANIPCASIKLRNDM